MLFDMSKHMYVRIYASPQYTCSCVSPKQPSEGIIRRILVSDCLYLFPLASLTVLGCKNSLGFS